MPDSTSLPAAVPAPRADTMWTFAEALDVLDPENRASLTGPQAAFADAAMDLFCRVQSMTFPELMDLTDLAVITTALNTAAVPVPDACSRMSAWLADQFTAGNLAARDGAPDAGESVSQAWHYLEAARSSAGNLSGALVMAGLAVAALRRAGDGEDR